MANRIDQIVAKSAGKIKAVRARLDGLVGVFTTLAEQHAEAKAMFERIQKDSGKRRELWPELRKALLSHEKGEIRVVYPELRNHAETVAMATQHDREARELEDMIHRLDGLPIESSEWGATFDQLASKVIAHATEEEQQIFPAAQHAIGDPRIKELDAPLKAAQKSVKDSV